VSTQSDIGVRWHGSHLVPASYSRSLQNTATHCSQYRLQQLKKKTYQHIYEWVSESRARADASRGRPGHMSRSFSQKKRHAKKNKKKAYGVLITYMNESLGTRTDASRGRHYPTKEQVGVTSYCHPQPQKKKSCDIYGWVSKLSGRCIKGSSGAPVTVNLNLKKAYGHIYGWVSELSGRCIKGPPEVPVTVTLKKKKDKWCQFAVFENTRW